MPAAAKGSIPAYQANGLANILVVDDAEATRYIVRHALVRAGYGVLEAGTATEARQRVREGADLVILDVNLPDESGFQVCRDLKADPATAHIPVLHMSAKFTKGGDYAQGLESGADGYLIQPVEPAVLLATVRALLRGSQAERKLAQLNAELEERVAQRTAELRTLNAELEAFSYTVSHDLRAPLRHILSYADLLQETAGHCLDENSSRFVTTIAQSARRMETLIDDLLVLSRIGRSTMVEKQIDMRQLVEDVRQELASEVGERQIDWRIAPLPTVRADAPLLQAVWMNLLSNAIKYTRPRETAIVEVGHQLTDTEVIFFVRDNGVGFDMRYKDKLFGVFQRLHRVEEFPGTGIGLASVRRAIQRHGGRAWAEGELDSGATFYFSLPLKVLHADA